MSAGGIHSRKTLVSLTFEMAFRGAEGGPGLQSKVKKTNFEMIKLGIGYYTKFWSEGKKNSFAIIVLSRVECKNYQFAII